MEDNFILRVVLGKERMNFKVCMCGQCAHSDATAFI